MSIIKTVNIIKDFLLAVPILLVLSTVFIVDHSLGNGVVFGKYFWFYGSMAGVTIATVIAFFVYRKPVRIQTTDGLIFLLFLVILLSSYFIPEYIGNTTKYTLLLLSFILYGFLRIFFTQCAHSRYALMLFFLLTGLVEAIWGLCQLYGWEASNHHLFKLTGSFFNPGPYSGYLAMVAPATFYYLLSDGRITKHSFYWRLWPFYLRFVIAILTFCTIISVLPAAMSRASWLACIGGCGLVIVGYYRKNKKVQIYIQQHKKQCITGLLSGCVILSGLVAGMYRMKKDSADGRALIWKISVEMIPKHPFGVGLGKFSGQYGLEQADYFASGRGTNQEEYVAGNPEYAFNEYLQVAVELGIIPLVLLISILIYSIYIGIKNKKTAWAVSLLSLSIFASMSYPFSVLPFLIGLVYLLSETTTKMNIDHKANHQNKTKYSNFIFLICIIALSTFTFILLKDTPSSYQAYKRWKLNPIIYLSGNKDIQESCSKDYPYLSDQITFLFDYAQSLSKSGQFSESNRVLERAVQISCDPMLYNVMGKNYQGLKDYISSEQSYLKAAQIVPNRVYPYYLLTKLYIETGDSVKAKAAAKMVLTKEPKVQSTAIKEMRKEIKELLDIKENK